jgi:3-dehydroquinate dehydratase-2
MAKAMQILVLNGPNINLLGAREPDTYGSVTMDEINKSLEALAKANGLEIAFYQSNIEGELVNKIQEASQSKVTGIIINPAAYTHTSVAIRDAIAASKIPTIEVHLSNVYKREEFRHKSITAPVCKGQICGFGAQSYMLALHAFIDANNDDASTKDFSSLA